MSLSGGPIGRHSFIFGSCVGVKHAAHSNVAFINGTNTLTVNGNSAKPNGSYIGDVSFTPTAAVPELAAQWLMIGGVGVEVLDVNVAPDFRRFDIVVSCSEAGWTDRRPSLPTISQRCRNPQPGR